VFEFAVWFSLIVASLLGEIFTSSLPLLGFSLGGVFALVAKSRGADLAMQMAIFAVLGSLLDIIYFVYIKKRLKSTVPRTPRMEENLLGKEFILDTDVIENVTLKIDGIYWTIVNKGYRLRKGQKVRISSLQGTKLVVEKVNDENKQGCVEVS